MIPVRETKPGVFERLGGNPTLISIDGEVKAPLLTILAPSWTAEDRAKFGIHMVEPATVPEGKQAVGQPRYEKQGDTVVEVRDLRDAPPPQPRRDVFAELDALAARIAALEGKQ
jgi:hypothetical protein